ncbi:hypothetical protein RRG08_012258 [Elysia crispata]|uniref:VWFA domain-containing protein n=1 Tax=Elysia crispata TaxID=231223 RepID=A0AAE1BAW2_9GAST|nr:hypothetical protein RRG08_012258 [Elysia crispata]
MNFASKYVLAYSGDEYESLSEEEFVQGMHVSDSNSSDSDEDLPRSLSRCYTYSGRNGSGNPSPQKKKRLQRAKYHWKGKQAEHPRGQSVAGGSDAANKKGLRRKFRKADTNVMSVNFDTLLSPGNMYAGDPVPCPKCSAILSHISKAEGEEQKVWQCEFCEEQVLVDLEPEEIPGTEDVTYLLSPAPSTSSMSMAGVDRSLVVFCVDTSGSMCVTSEISGKIKLRGNNQLRRLESFNEGNENQFLPSQRNREVTYVSRLQAMQAAVDHQLNQMAQQHPDRRVALVAFNNEVSVMGDGSEQEITVAGDKLNDVEKLREITQDLKLPNAIKATYKALGEKVYSLEEGGATALGPALVVSVNIAASHPGSKVILCTDGKANIGLGKLEGDSERCDKEVEEEALEFYTKTAGEAAEKGVTVSVITIQGTDCKLVHLGTMADKTGGQVNIVDCMKLTEEFGNILADPIIATKVKATFLLHKELYVLNDHDLDKQESRAEQNVGNVKKSSTISFEFAKRKSSTASGGAADSENHQEQVSIPTPAEGGSGATATGERQSAQQEFPFQLQIEYIDSEGNKALRVITRKLPATTDRSVTEEAVNLEVLGTHAANKSADLALQGQYSRSRGVALMNQRLAWRQAHSDKAPKERKIAYKNIFGKIKSMENHVQQKQMMEIKEYGCTRSDSDEDIYEDTPEVSRSHGAPHPILHRASPEKLDQARARKSLSARKSASKSRSRSSKAEIASKHKKMHSARSSEMGDDMANMIYQFRSVGANELTAPTPTTSEEIHDSKQPEPKQTQV